MKFAVVGCQHFHIKMFIDEMLKLGHQFEGIMDDSDYFLPQQYAEAYNVPLFQSMDELSDRQLDIIGNAGANDQKIDVIEWGEKHGIHVMTDKPVAIDKQALNRFRNVIDRGQIEVGMMLTARFNPMQYTLKKMIDEDELGRILDITFLKPHKLDAAKRPEWFFDKRRNGGLIIDLMIHDVDMLHWLTGKSIVGYQGMLIKNILPQYPDFYDNAQMNLLLEEQITATLKTDWLMPEKFDLWGDGRIFVTGEKGRVEIRLAGDVFANPGPYITLSTHATRTKKLEVIQPPNGLAGDFINRIKKKPHQLTAEDVYRCNELVLRLDTASMKMIHPHI